jgi:malate dehydrogenase (quinone)
MIQVLERCFGQEIPGLQKKLQALIPSFGTKLSADPKKAAASLESTAETLKLK